MEAKKRRATAERILQAAASLFAEKGFANVSVRDICKEAGTTAPVIYYHYGNKKGLFDAVARKKISMADFICELSSAAGDADPRKGMERFVATYLFSFPEHSFDPGLYLRDSASLDKRSARMAFEDLEKVRATALGLVERCVAKGYFRRADPGMASDCLLGMLNREIFQHIHFSRTGDRETYRKFVTDFFFRAMAP